MSAKFLRLLLIRVAMYQGVAAVMSRCKTYTKSNVCGIVTPPKSNVQSSRQPRWWLACVFHFSLGCGIVETLWSIQVLGGMGGKCLPILGEHLWKGEMFLLCHGITNSSGITSMCHDSCYMFFLVNLSLICSPFTNLHSPNNHLEFFRQ